MVCKNKKLYLCNVAQINKLAVTFDERTVKNERIQLNNF